jgi:hypothetical protein
VHQEIHVVDGEAVIASQALWIPDYCCGAAFAVDFFIF